MVEGDSPPPNHAPAHNDKPLSLRSLATHFGWSALRTWGEKVTAFLVFVVLARLLPPDQIGALAYLTVIIAVVQVVADGALSEWLVQHADATRDQEASIFTLQSALALVATIVLAASGFYWAPMAIGRPDSGWILATLSITVLLSSTQKVPEALLRRNLDFKLIALRSFVAYLLGGVIGIGCAVGGAGIWSLVIKQIVEALILCIFTFHAAKWWPRLGLSFGETRDARRFAGGVLGSWIFTNISSRADSFVVGSLLGTTALGYYSVALRIYFLVRDVFVMVFQRVSISYFAALSAEPSRFSSLFVTLIKATTRLFAPAIATLIGMTPVLIPVLFGARWSAAAGPLQWLSLIPLTMTATCYSWPVMLAKNQTHRILQLTLVGAMWAVAFAVVGCHFGITGAAIGVASQVLITAPLGFYWVAPHAELSLSKIGSTLLPAALGCICALLGASTVSLILAAQQNIIRLLLSLSVGLVLGYGTEYLALNRDERSELWRLVNNLCRSGGALDWSRLATGVKEH